MNTEHCEVLVSALRPVVQSSALLLILRCAQNELVRARLRHEELESELVRYKLLYVTRVPLHLRSDSGPCAGTPRRCTRARMPCPRTASRSSASGGATARTGETGESRLSCGGGAIGDSGYGAWNLWVSRGKEAVWISHVAVCCTGSRSPVLLLVACMYFT